MCLVECDQASGEAVHRVYRKRDAVANILHSRCTGSGRNLEVQDSDAASFFLETDANPALANAELRAILQHGCPDPLLVKKRAVGGIQIF